MSIKKTSVSVSLAETNLDAPQLESPQPALPTPTYLELEKFHLKQVELNREGNRRPQQSLDNERSIISNWTAILKLDPLGHVGEELGVRFNESQAKYLLALEEKGLSKRTLDDRKCITGKLRESFIEFKRTCGLPPDFCHALKRLVETTGLSLRKLSAKSGISDSRIFSWMNDRQMPSRNSLVKIRKLEEFFKVEEGTLSSRLPDVIWMRAPVCRGATPWRSKLCELHKLRYLLPSFPDQLQKEWDELMLFYTDEQWVLERGFKRNSEWRVRWNNNRCVTSDIHSKELRCFFGYLCLPPTNQDKRMAGLGFSLCELTLALLSDANLILITVCAWAGTNNHNG
jgi:transcriptional regulator with XRE-family HTH domain